MSSLRRLDQLEAALEHKELHRATCLLMDLVRDYSTEQGLLQEAMAIRQYYNSCKVLGKQELAPQETQQVLERSAALFSTIQQLPLESLDASMRQEYPVRPFLKANNIRKTYGGKGTFALGPVDAVLSPGQITGIVGENGNGKTTLLRILAGMLNTDSGTLDYTLAGETCSDPYLIKQRIVYIPQRLSAWQGTLKENLHFAAAIHGIHGAHNEQIVAFVIHRMGLSNFANFGWSELSSGYKLRFELAKTLVWSPSILILDEPLANLDINAQQWLLQDFKQLVSSLRHPLSIVLSSQQLHEVEHIADNLIYLRNGQCDYSGRRQDFMQQRSFNLFEVSGRFSIHDLRAALPPDWELSEKGSNFTIRTPLSIDAAVLLQQLLEKKFTLLYFRDISTSTKQLFQL
ncbi:MAG: ABC transporter ATP-binding protein [Cytophagaceae bacterium]|nr:ABC transporter ATP-binding protein [Cytophagaceae bacterium]